ncbi:hypothetical protein [Gemmatimonas sp.]|uniref:hypothetical protein n=1 Tax=Gemmatimonas sp. TaxID=1962908 RepID=UPI002ED9CAC7
MYQTCIHCLRPLGANESIEALPVGRRLAFDAAKGRLWVICRVCERWNLAPFEQRWEAIEQAERAFRGTRVRVSTDNIGLARLPDDTELVRVGAPQRPEFAAWRYGDQFGRRRRKAIIMAGGATLGVGAAVSGALLTGAGLVALLPVFQLLNVASIVSRTHQTMRQFALPEGGAFVPVGLPRLISGGDDGWGVEVGYSVLRKHDDPRPFPGWFSPKWDGEGKNEMGRLRLYGVDAVPLLRWAMPRANRAGARRSAIADGVRMIENAGGPDRYPAWAATQVRDWAARSTFGDTGSLDAIPAPARLAFEMAVHEDSERRAMDGELASLEKAWRDAEEVATIADKLLVPTSVMQRLAQLKRGLGRG